MVPQPIGIKAQRSPCSSSALASQSKFEPHKLQCVTALPGQMSGQGKAKAAGCEWVVQAALDRPARPAACLRAPKSHPTLPCKLAGTHPQPTSSLPAHLPPPAAQLGLQCSCAPAAGRSELQQKLEEPGGCFQQHSGRQACTRLSLRRSRAGRLPLAAPLPCRCSCPPPPPVPGHPVHWCRCQAGDYRPAGPPGGDHKGASGD